MKYSIIMNHKMTWRFLVSSPEFNSFFFVGGWVGGGGIFGQRKY